MIVRSYHRKGQCHNYHYSVFLFIITKTIIWLDNKIEPSFVDTINIFCTQLKTMEMKEEPNLATWVIALAFCKHALRFENDIRANNFKILRIIKWCNKISIGSFLCLYSTSWWQLKSKETTYFFIAPNSPIVACMIR